MEYRDIANSQSSPSPLLSLTTTHPDPEMKTRRNTKKSLPAHNTGFTGLFAENAAELGLANLGSDPAPPPEEGEESDDDASASSAEASDENSEDYSVGDRGEPLPKLWKRWGDDDSSCSSDTSWTAELDDDMLSGSETDWSAESVDEVPPSSVGEGERLPKRSRRQNTQESLNIGGEGVPGEVSISNKEGGGSKVSGTSDVEAQKQNTASSPTEPSSSASKAGLVNQGAGKGMVQRRQQIHQADHLAAEILQNLLCPGVGQWRTSTCYKIR